MPLRYALIALSTVLLLLGGDGAVLSRTMLATAALGLGTFLVTSLGMMLLLGAGVRRTLPPSLLRTITVVRPLASMVAVALALDALIVLVLSLALLAAPIGTTYPTDAISLPYEDAALVLVGRNPYTSNGFFASALARFPGTLATPLRGGAFGAGYEYPSDASISRVQQRYLADPASVGRSFDPATLHSYPALSFLLYVPMVAAGMQNILILHVVTYLALLAWLVALAPAGMRRWAGLAALANAIILGYSFIGDAQGLCLALILAAWHWRDRRWAGPVLLGLACAFRQYCWFFAPFMLLDVALTQGWRRAARYGVMTLLAFLLPNAPYILASPGPWFGSLWLPMTDPMFPTGMGAVTLFVSHVLPYPPPALFAGAEAAALGAALWCQARWRSILGDGVLLLALVPLLFAFRSLPNYFAIAPWLALYAANRAYMPRGPSRVPPAPYGNPTFWQYQLAQHVRLNDE